MAAIEVRGVSKRFRLSSDKYQSLKERLIHFGRGTTTDFWALRDVDLDVEEGTTLGLIGHNGSGKSTLLKCIAGLLQPTGGEIRTAGRIAALLELGAGFHPELTGRENVYLNASILGLSRREIDQRFDEMVGFAELEQFIDQQVRHYSSGMYVRLGFAVAVNVDPDILLVDEVLAVGDEAFQRKCLDRVRQFQREGRTIIFVSHAADLVRQICDQAAVLDHGDLVFSGGAGEAVRVLRERMLPAAGAPAPRGAEPPAADQAVKAPAAAVSRVRITGVTMTHPGSGERVYVLPGDPLAIRVAYEADQTTAGASVSFAIYDNLGRMLYGVTTHALGIELPALSGSGEIVLTVTRVPFLDGEYPITLGITSCDGGTVYDWREQNERFEVMNPGVADGMVDVPLEVEVAAEVVVDPAP